MRLEARLAIAKHFVKCLVVAAIVAVLAILFSMARASAQCPPGVVCPNQQPRVIYAPAPVPLYRAPIREAINKAGRAVHQFMTPQGVVMQGYYIAPAAPLTAEQILANQRYWNAQAARLAAPQPH